LLKEAGGSAVGTLLDRDNPAYEALLQKQSYEGPVTLFGHRYERAMRHCWMLEGNCWER